MSSPDSDDPDSRTPGNYPSEYPSDYHSPPSGQDPALDGDSDHSSPYRPPPSLSPTPPPPRQRRRTPTATQDNYDDIDEDDALTAWDIAQARMRREEGSYSPPSSADSAELHATRPNRWTGAPSTWRGLTEGDRAIWEAMEGGRKKELGVHLVGAWGVRGGRRRGRAMMPEDGDDEDSGKDSRAGTPRKRRRKKKTRGWSPGKMWTAWPMRYYQVPVDDLMSEESGDEQYKVPRTTKWRDLTKQNTNLEEAISATVLRIAKDKFMARGWSKEAMLDSVEAGAADDDGAAAGVTDGEGETGGNGKETRGGQPQKQGRAKSPTSLKPVPTADDELSYALLRPVSRKIMGQLDETLHFLHYARESGLGLKKRNVGSETETGSKKKKGKAAASKMGRATKSPAVTDGEKMDIDPPVGPPVGPPVDPPAEESTGRGRAAKEKQKSQPSRSQPRSTRSRSRSRAPSSSKKIRKWATRDWRDIIGVAAMAGFPPKVIARATQRCSTLFNQPMHLHHMPDGPAPMETTTYVPGAPLPPSDDEDFAEIKVQQLRAVSRNSSRRTSISLDTDATTGTTGKGRKSTPGGKDFFCPHFTCPRAVEPFTRRANLIRHLTTMHAGVEAAAQLVEVKSADEMDGSVHVDGFLKRVRARRGWRGEDVKARTRKTGLKYKTAGTSPKKRPARKKSTFDSD